MNSWYELSGRSTAWWPLEILRLLSSLIKAAVLVLYAAPSRHSEILLCPSNDFRNRHLCLGLDQLRQCVHALFFIYLLHCLPRSRDWQQRVRPNLRRRLHRQANTLIRGPRRPSAPSQIDRMLSRPAPRRLLMQVYLVRKHPTLRQPYASAPAPNEPAP
jgi:hypothetical protein